MPMTMKIVEAEPKTKKRQIVYRNERYLFQF